MGLGFMVYVFPPSRPYGDHFEAGSSGTNSGASSIKSSIPIWKVPLWLVLKLLVPKLHIIHELFMYCTVSPQVCNTLYILLKKSTSKRAIFLRFWSSLEYV